MASPILLTASKGATGKGTSKERTSLGSYVTIGSGEDGTVTITETEPATTGGGYSVTVKVNTNASQDLSAALAAKALTVTLATDADNKPDDEKNTATLIAAAINAIDNTPFTAEASGEGNAPLTAAEAKQDILPLYKDITAEVVVGFKPTYVKVVVPAASNAGIVTEWQAGIDDDKAILHKEDTGYSCAALAADGITVTGKGFIMGHACQVSEKDYYWIAFG